MDAFLIVFIAFAPFCWHLKMFGFRSHPNEIENPETEIAILQSTEFYANCVPDLNIASKLYFGRLFCSNDFSTCC